MCKEINCESCTAKSWPLHKGVRARTSRWQYHNGNITKYICIKHNADEIETRNQSFPAIMIGHITQYLVSRAGLGFRRAWRNSHVDPGGRRVRGPGCSGFSGQGAGMVVPLKCTGRVDTCFCHGNKCKGQTTQGGFRQDSVKGRLHNTSVTVTCLQTNHV